MTVLAWPAFESPTGNPYTRLLYERVEAHDVVVDDFTGGRALRNGYDLWHLHWPDDFLSKPSPWSALFYVVAELILIFLARQRGTKIVWTVHDLGPHESPHPWLEALFWPLFVPMVDGFITLSEHARREALARFPHLRTLPGAVIPHGHYRPAYPVPASRAAARTEWELPENAVVAAFVGRIRPYKNVDRLIQTFRKFESRDARLLVTGNPVNDGLASDLRAAAKGDNRIHLDLRFIPEEEISSVLAAADLVVLPYDHIMHSGSALLSLSFHRPVLVPARGAMKELQSDVGPKWVFTYDPPLTPTDLETAFQTARAGDRPREVSLAGRSWDTLADQTVRLYEQVLRPEEQSDNESPRPLSANVPAS